jgi:hypothetical protein
MRAWYVMYDFIDTPPRIFPTVILLGGFVLSIFFYFYSKAQTSRKDSFLESPQTARAISIFAMIFFGFLFIGILSPVNYFKTRRIYFSDQAKSVEGVVENYHPMPASGHDTERFEVGGVHFEYSDYSITSYGYNNATSKGGVIKEGMLVRIKYYSDGYQNHILKLETD